jgi:pimeloyl-ACP methyl ester carboxylesterase
MSRPHYVTTPYGQVRLWLAGDGPTLVIVAGLTRSAETTVRQAGAALPGWRIIAVDPPGLGGSARAAAGSLSDAAATIAGSLEFLAGEPWVLAAAELSAALLPDLLNRVQPVATVLVDTESAVGWVAHRTLPPALEPRDDGTHLTALWSFLRDRRLIRADEPTLPIATGAPLPDVAELDSAFRAAMPDPPAFARLWAQTSGALPDALRALPAGLKVRDWPEFAGSGMRPAASAATPPSTAPALGTEIWHQYLDTAVGRAHLRRAGSAGPPMLVLSTGGGSSAQFAPVVSGFAENHTVAALDYFGNGLSERLARQPDIAVLAREALAVADALGWAEFDVWGSHTGACVALEMTVLAPDRVRTGVYEAPVVLAPEFREELLGSYFPDLTPDKFGLHVSHVWNWRRDAFLYWPWYHVAHSAARAMGLPSAAELHRYAVGILESGRSYHLAYRAAFGYDTRARLPLLRRPAMLTAGPHDMLANALTDAGSLAPDGLLRVVPTPATVWWPDPEPAAAEATIRIYREFFDEAAVTAG